MLKVAQNGLFEDDVKCPLWRPPEKQKPCNVLHYKALWVFAESKGFEPLVRQVVHLISNQARSTTPATLLRKLDVKITRKIDLSLNRITQ